MADKATPKIADKNSALETALKQIEKTFYGCSRSRLCGASLRP